MRAGSIRSKSQVLESPAGDQLWPQDGMEPILRPRYNPWKLHLLPEGEEVSSSKAQAPGRPLPLLFIYFCTSVLRDA